MKVGLLILVCLGVSLAIMMPKNWGFKDTPRQRAEAMLAKMNTTEKFLMIHGSPGRYVGNVPAIPRLGIPTLTLEDGPQGVADGVSKVTAWPSALTVMASWDRTMMYNYAAAMGKEQRGKGTNIMLGPMVNIARIPMGGRNFESFGEDPYLASQMVTHSITGIQSQNIMATVKHFIDNNQEYHRTTVSANIDERTQYEIYYPAFKAAIDAGVCAVMCSYNKINSTWACENEVSLTTDLKTTMGFQGFVMSDWGATHSTAKAANAGLDMQMPDASYFGTALQKAVSSGAVQMSRIDDMVVRILTSMYACGLFDHPRTGNIDADVQSPEHVTLARTLSEAGTVLLKNGGILPLDMTKIKSIAVIGDDGNANPIATGGGSGKVRLPYLVTPLTGITKRAGSAATVTYASSSSITSAVNMAKAADVAIVFGATTSHEGADRSSLDLDGNTNDLIAAVAAAQENTVVVLHNPGAVVMPWVDKVSSIVTAFMPGQEDGNAIASILFGDVNPSGKLPLTFTTSEKLIPTNTTKQYPGINDQGAYSEKLLVGYRWYDANKIDPLFPFGHGLSYTTFKYDNLVVNKYQVSCQITNSGDVAGSEVVQLYLAFPSSAGEPPLQLKGFEKVSLAKGASTTVTFTLSNPDFSIWDSSIHGWKLVTGSFFAHIGSSSRDIRLAGAITVA